MSAVGLLLLEDPKARARAEARIRNGQTKRRSFFGRPGNAKTKPRKFDLPPTIPDEGDEHGPVIVRPSTALSLPGPHRNDSKKTEGTERSNSRNSIFGRKNSVGASSIQSATSGVSQQSGAGSTPSSATAERNERAKDQIMAGALPNRAHLPALQTVQEKDIPVRGKQSMGLPSLNTHIYGGPPDDRPSPLDSDVGTVDSTPISAVSSKPPSLPPAARISRFDDAIFKNVSPSSIDTANSSPRLPPSMRTTSTLVSPSSAISDKSQSSQIPPVPSKFARDTTSANMPMSPEIHAATGPNPMRNGSIDSGSNLVTHCQELSRPLTERLPSEKGSYGSLQSGNPGASQSHVDPVTQPENEPYSQETDYARSSVSTGMSRALSFSSGVRGSTTNTVSTWEDEVDFMYEQGAEACASEWDFQQHARIPSVQSDGDLRLSRAFHMQTSQIPSDVHRRDSRTLSGVGATIAQRRHAQKVAETTRGFSVGHRGFAAARNSTEDYPAKRGATLNNLSLSPSDKKEDGLMPNYGVANADGGTPNSPFTPNSPYTPNVMEFPVPPSNGHLSDNLSEPESWRHGPKHRKSSSYGSIESFARTSAATSATSAKETNRWSLASQSSVPSLIHSRPKRTSSLSKGMISAPVSVLPEHPENDRAFEVEERPLTSPSNQADSEADNFVLRRPQTAGERLLLQAAGRQRYRPNTSHGNSGTNARLSQPAEASKDDTTSSTNALDWI